MTLNTYCVLIVFDIIKDNKKKVNVTIQELFGCVL